jgi:hypothetical protein
MALRDALRRAFSPLSRRASRERDKLGREGDEAVAERARLVAEQERRAAAVHDEIGTRYRTQGLGPGGPLM